MLHARISVIALALGSAVGANERLKLLWLAIGKEDGGVKNKQALSAALKEIGVKHEYHETDGAHRWSVWRLYLAEFLPRLFR
jgi:enterochelin esterase family protein